MSEQQSDGTVQVESATVVLQDWCDWCDEEGVKLTHAIDVKRFDFAARFCSLQCAARWGCAADQDEIEEMRERTVNAENEQ
jgi:hypothetical protein